MSAATHHHARALIANVDQSLNSCAVALPHAQPPAELAHVRRVIDDLLDYRLVLMAARDACAIRPAGRPALTWIRS